jgi:hypothetical protein
VRVRRGYMDEFVKNAVAEMHILYGGEEDHIRADEILCEVMEKLGYNELVQAFTKVEKWYA